MIAAGVDASSTVRGAVAERDRASSARSSTAQELAGLKSGPTYDSFETDTSAFGEASLRM